MTVMIALGTLDLVIAPFLPAWWLSAISILFALFAYFIAWLNYRAAKKIALALDEPVEISVTVIEQNPSHEGSATADKPETPADEHEDTGHPV